MIQSIILFLLFIFTPFQKEPPAKTDLKYKLVSVARKNHIPTLSVIVKSDKVNLEFKYRDPDKGIEPVTNYGVASTTKFLSSLVILKNIEDHKIGLNDPIYKYVDSSAFKGISWFSKITVRHLLNHTSGIPDYTKNPEWIKMVMNSNPPKSYEEKIALVETNNLAARFGEHAYSNTNYVILEKIIETANHKNAREVFNEFYSKLNLPNISFNDSSKNQAFFSQQENGTGNVSAWQENYGFEGGAYCNTNDLHLILKKVFVEKTVLNQNSLDSLATWTDVNKYKINYGFAQMTAYGLGLMKYEFDGRVFIGHAGSSLKYQCFAFIEPSTGTEIILQTNCSGKYFNNAFFIDLIGTIVKNI